MQTRIQPGHGDDGHLLLVVEELLQAAGLTVLGRDLPSSGQQGAGDQIYSDRND